MPAAESFELTELADQAGVTPRTVRYYIQQGLLPSPGLRGPGARYERAHLDRLRLIRRLQREHLPLAEIRRRLEALDDDAVRALVEAPAVEERASPSSALDYVRDVLAGRGRTPSEPSATRAAPRVAGQRPAPSASPDEELVAELRGSPARGSPGAAFDKLSGALGSWLAQSESQPRSQPAERRSQWERITLAPDVELHIRRPLSREQNRLVERLLDAARELFRQEEP